LSKPVPVLTKNPPLIGHVYGYRKSPTFSIEYGDIHIHLVPVPIFAKILIPAISPSSFKLLKYSQLSKLIYIYIYIYIYLFIYLFINTQFLILIFSNGLVCHKIHSHLQYIFHLSITFMQLRSNDVCQLNIIYVLHLSISIF